MCAVFVHPTNKKDAPSSAGMVIRLQRTGSTYTACTLTKQSLSAVSSASYTAQLPVKCGVHEAERRLRAIAGAGACSQALETCNDSRYSHHKCYCGCICRKVHRRCAVLPQCGVNQCKRVCALSYSHSMCPPQQQYLHVRIL
jgi:hypothetical protein